MRHLSLPPNESRASFAWCFPKKYPLRLSGLDRDVLSDIMEQNPSARGQPGRTPSCISYIDFAQEMKAALGSLSADDSNHPWAAYMMPVWSDFVCFVSLQVSNPLGPSDILIASLRLERVVVVTVQKPQSLRLRLPFRCG